MWNWQFEVAAYNLHMANASVLVHGDPNNLNYDNSSNPGFWARAKIPLSNRESAQYH